MAATALATTKAITIMKSLANISVGRTDGMMMPGIGLFMEFNKISNGLMHF